VAMETEFQLLNARLSEKARNLEVAEEHIWRIWADYQQQPWTGSVAYPDSFNIRDDAQYMAQLKIARDITDNPEVIAQIDRDVLENLGHEWELILTSDTGLPDSYRPSDSDTRCANCEYYQPETSGCVKWDVTVSPVYWCHTWHSAQPQTD